MRAYYFKFKPNVGNDCHDLMQEAVSFNDVLIVLIFCIWVKIKTNTKKTADFKEKSGAS